MQVIFNNLSAKNLSNIEDKNLLIKNFALTCKAIKQVNDLISKNTLLLRVDNMFWTLGIWSEIEDGFNNPDFLFLRQVLDSPYLPEKTEKEEKIEKEIEESIFLDENLCFDNYKIGYDDGLRVASSWKNGILIVSFNIGEWEDLRDITVKGSIGNINLKNASKPEHIYELLEYFPIWGNYDFNKWGKEPFNKVTSKEGEKGENYIKNAKYDVKVLPIPKLSDLVWLHFIGETEIWDNYDKTRTRDILWKKFVDKLDTFPNGGQKEAQINPIFEKIVKVNQFQDAKSICSKPKRPIYTWFRDYYLLPDKQHGAFEVYNDKQVHQGEWHFYGDENMEKPAEKDRDICN